MNAGKNRKRDLVQLCEVYSSHLLGEGLKDYDPAQQQGGSQQARMAPNMGTETHTGAVQAGLNKDPLLNPEGESEETYEGEEETLQERSGRMLTRQGWKKGEVTPKGNWVYTKADQPDAHVGTDGLINGQDPKQFLGTTGVDAGSESEENDQSLPEPEDTGINADENRGSWGSAAFGNESEEGHEDHEMLVGRSDGCPGSKTDHGAGDPTHNRHALGGAVDIIAKAIADQKMSEDENENNGTSNTDDDYLLKTHMGKVHGRDTDEVDQRYFKARNKQIDAAAKKQGFKPFPPDENAEDGAAAAMRADETENRKNLRAQNRVAKEYGFNRDENSEGFDDFVDAEDTDASVKRFFKEIDPEQWRAAKEAGWSGGATEDEEYPDVDDDDFCGPDRSFPVNNSRRAEKALKLAFHAKNPGKVKDCVHKKWPDLDEEEKKESYFKSKGDKAMTQLMESYQSVVKGNHGQIL